KLQINLTLNSASCEVGRPQPNLQKQVIEVSTILHLALHLLQAGFDLAKHRQTGADSDAFEASFEDSSSHHRASDYRQPKMIGIEKVGGHQSSPISRRICSLAWRSWSTRAARMRSWSLSGIWADSATNLSYHLLISVGSSE